MAKAKAKDEKKWYDKNVSSEDLDSVSKKIMEMIRWSIMQLMMMGCSCGFQ